MAEEQQGEKTEQPTPRKLEEARKKGQIWKSKDLTSSFVLLAGLGALAWLGPALVELLESFLRDSIKLATAHHVDGDAGRATLGGLLVLGQAIAPVLGAVVVVAFLAEAVQAQGVFTADTVMPKLEKVDPIKGLKNLFSKRQLVEMLKQTAKFGLAVWVCWAVIAGEVGSIVQMAASDAQRSSRAVAVLTGRLALKVALLYGGLGLLDAVYQWRRHMKEMMMTREEVKQEYKQSEGDPHHKAARKQLHQEILQHEMVQSVKDADVVVVNPDHIAIALKYDKEKDNAPKVIAKGQRVIAEQIKQIARENGVPIMRNVPLAHALLKVEVGEEIPEDLYDAVAEVLNWVYSLSEEEKKGAR